MPRLKDLNVLNLPIVGRNLASVRLVQLALLICASALLGACANTNTDETAAWSEAKLFTEAKDTMSEGDFDKCGKYFEKLEARFPFGPYSQQAQINSAYCFWKAQEPAQALVQIDRFIKLHQGNPNLDYAYYLKGLITFNDDLGFMGKLTGQDLSERDPKAAKEAFESFRVVAERFPNSKYTPDAIDRMRYIVNSLAEADVIVARYYFQRGAYLASANRAQLVIRDYDRAPAVEEALYILVQSYQALGMNDLSSDAMRVFKLNFPYSQIFKTGVRVQKEHKWWQFWITK
jgi:outer membrane protein assembly factor BamD